VGETIEKKKKNEHKFQIKFQIKQKENYYCPNFFAVINKNLIVTIQA
jgi:hypothetical protein